MTDTDIETFLMTKACAELSVELRRELTDSERELVQRLTREIFNEGKYEGQ